MPGPPPVLVIPGIGNLTLGLGHGLVVATGLRDQPLAMGCFFTQEARTAKHHHGLVDAMGLQGQVGFEEFELKADAACFTAKQELGVRESQAVGIG